MSVESQVGLRFVLRWSDGRSEQLVVDSERALIGSAAHCEVRLPPEESPSEYADVFIDKGVVCLSTRGGEPAAGLASAPGAASVWQPGRSLVIGSLSLTAEAINLGASRKGTSPFLLFLSVPLVALAAAVMYGRVPPPSEATIPEAPPLFDRAVEACPSPRGEQLVAFASEKLRVALAKRERSPFSPHDGIEAVPLFELAAVCFRVAGSHEEELEARGAGDALRRRTEDEYRARRVRMEHAFRVGDPFGAKRELGVLIPMTSHLRGPYIDWMVWLDRYASKVVEERMSSGLGRR